jgi:hypothetical protein
MDDELRQLVIARAQGRCEYCHLPERFSFFPFQIDHIIAEKHGGPTVAENLALSCFYCNSYKGPNIAGWLSESNEVIRLFHPRSDEWSEHFEWSETTLVGKTKIGQVTIAVLAINRPDAKAVRAWIRHIGESFDG